MKETIQQIIDAYELAVSKSDIENFEDYLFDNNLDCGLCHYIEQKYKNSIEISKFLELNDMGYLFDTARDKMWPANKAVVQDCLQPRIDYLKKFL